MGDISNILCGVVLWGPDERERRERGERGERRGRERDWTGEREREGEREGEREREKDIILGVWRAYFI